MTDQIKNIGDVSHLTKTHYKVASSAEDLETILKIRTAVFVGEDGYPPDRIKVNADDYNLLGFYEGVPKGTIAVTLGQSETLPLGSTLGWKGITVAEIHKLAIIKDARKTPIALGLMVLAYEYTKKHAKDILSFCLKNKESHIHTLEKFGFKIIKEFNFLDQPAYILHLNLEDTTFEKEKSYRRLKLLKKLLVK
ncbi:MAG: hypothetical protein WC527_08425 [Candidatus Margulisiibacteriota bacterium]